MFYDPRPLLDAPSRTIYFDVYNIMLLSMSTRGSTTTMLALVSIAATALILSTGTAIVDGPTDTINDEVALQPGDNPYAYLDEDGELAVEISDDNLRIDAEGVNVDAVAA
jgi:hypothetical protein